MEIQEVRALRPRPLSAVAAIGVSVTVYGENVRVCSDENVLMCACEFVGMLRAIRWIADHRLAWNHPAVTEVGPAAAG